jgi:hypothetical protein
MLVADQVSPLSQVHHRQQGRRSRSSRFARSVRKTWRRTRLRRAIISLFLTIAAVFAGYYASMYVVNRDVPSPAELGVEARR